MSPTCDKCGYDYNDCICDHKVCQTCGGDPERHDMMCKGTKPMTPNIDLAKLKGISVEASEMCIARQNILDFINGNVFPPTIIPDSPKASSTVDEYHRKRDQLQSILLSRIMVGAESIATRMLALAAENERLHTVIKDCASCEYIFSHPLQSTAPKGDLGEKDS